MNWGWADEPVLWVALANAIIILLAAFGVPISDEQKSAILGLLAAVLALIGALIARSRVTPASELQKPATDSHN